MPTADRAKPGPPNGAFVIGLILNCDNLADTLQCVKSVRKSEDPRHAVWVVDNGSDADVLPENSATGWARIWA